MFNCQVVANENSCPDPILCPNPPCPKEVVIFDLESQKSGSDVGTIVSLTFQQQSILQDELNLLLEDENQGMDPALNFITLVEPINNERSARPVMPSRSFENGLSIAPNPAKNWVLASFDAPQVAYYSALTLSDLNGRIVREINLSDDHGASQISVSLEGLPEGIYLLRLLLDGQPKGIQKVVVMQ